MLNAINQKISNFKYFLPPDIFERHKFIGNKIPNSSTVLDVGGSLSRLSNYCKAKSITTADIKKPADIVYDGNKIPVKNNSYDIVTSIDVLEHVPQKFRNEFIKELFRIANKHVILSAPYGSNKHIEYEKKILKYYLNKNISVPYLEEHVDIGLPRPEEIKEFALEYKHKLFYSGSIGLTELFFRIHNFESENKFLNQIGFLIKSIFYLLVNIFYYPFIINRKESENINRFYLVLTK